MRGGRARVFPTERWAQRQNGSEERDGEGGRNERDEQHTATESNGHSTVKCAAKSAI